jgi:methyl-accepting chemotaxis protein
MNIKTSLKEAIGSLNALPEMLEQDFLRVGGKLQAIAHTTREITQNSGQLVALMTDASMGKLTEELNRVLDSLGADSDENSGGGDIHLPLDGMETLLGAAHKSISELQSRVGSLRNLALLTRITSRSSGLNGEQFDGVAESIKNLGSRINERTAAILTGLKRLGLKARDASARTQVSRARKDHLAECIVREIRNSIKMLGKAHEHCGSFSTLISDQSTEMTGSIAGVVSSIQYHDITRQKMEHARFALEDILAGCRKSVDPSRLDNELEISDMCELQSVQLHHAHREIVHAIHTMETSLTTIADTSASIEANAARLSGAAGEINDSNLAGVDHDLSAAISYYDEDVKAGEELYLLIQSVVETTGEITDFLDAIDGIGEEIKLIALNAMVKALQLQDGGAGLHVIAIAIKNESDGICAETAAISEHFHKTTIMADQLKHLVEQVHGTGLVEQESLSIHLKAKLGEVQERNRSIVEAVQVILAASRQLRELIADALRSVSASRLHASLATSVIPTLESIVLGLRKNQPRAPGKRGDGEMFGKLRGAYTMNLEREVHARYLTGETETGGKVLPFPGRDWAPPVKTITEGNLGLNVELF